jgi:hypothetical protein
MVFDIIQCDIAARIYIYIHTHMVFDIIQCDIAARI